jgi:hypothetical protein
MTRYTCIKTAILVIAAAAVIGVFAPALAAYVTPMIGGGEVGKTGAPMKHIDVSFVGKNIGVVVDDTVATPLLRPLTPPNEFDPAMPWSVLAGKAYNYQYAFNANGFITLTPSEHIWVERLAQDSGLEVYLRPPQWVSTPATPTWTQIFTADGYRWEWLGSMQHNAYAVLNPTVDVYEATYRVYIGDANGVPLAGYGSQDVTITWNAVPVPEPATMVLLASGAAALWLRRRTQRAAPG